MGCTSHWSHGDILPTGKFDTRTDDGALKHGRLTGFPGRDCRAVVVYFIFFSVIPGCGLDQCWVFVSGDMGSLSDDCTPNLCEVGISHTLTMLQEMGNVAGKDKFFR